MYPELLRLGRFEIRAYGMMLAISFLVGIYWSMYRAQKRGIDRNHIMDISVFIVLCAIVGARFMYVVTHLEEFRGHWLDTINPFPSSGEIGIGGLTMLGGVILALTAILIYCQIKKISVLRLCDVMAPAFGLGIFLTRIGCFLNGCCFGRPSDLPWGMTFPLISLAGSILPDVHLHPTQLYSSFYGLVILIVILLLDRKPRFDGFLLSVFFMLYGVFRFVVDFMRYYDYEPSVRLHVFGMLFTINQVISFLMFLGGLFFFVVLRRRK